MTLQDLPHLNASLNATSTVLILAGYVLIRRKREFAHKACMLTAVVVSALFLTSYVIYHLGADPVKFAGRGVVRPLYFALLISHVVLAAAVPFLVTVTVYRALRDRRAAHRRIARWTLPIWLYVSFTGVLVYLMLYQWFQEGA